MGLGIGAVRRIRVLCLVVVYVTVLFSSAANTFRFGISEQLWLIFEYSDCISSFLNNRNSVAKLPTSLSFGFLLSIGVYVKWYSELQVVP